MRSPLSHFCVHRERKSRSAVGVGQFNRLGSRCVTPVGMHRVRSSALGPADTYSVLLARVRGGARDESRSSARWINKRYSSKQRQHHHHHRYHCHRYRRCLFVLPLSRITVFLSLSLSSCFLLRFLPLLLPPFRPIRSVRGRR